MERVSQRLGRLILGDTPLSPMQQATGADRESAEASAGMGERQAPQPIEQGPRSFEPRSYDGVPVAESSCVQSFDPHDRRVKCHVCCLWIHNECIETLYIGVNWYAEMCLACQQRSTRKLRVIGAIEMRRGNRWN